jgi:signal transduction histidine kinase
MRYLFLFSLPVLAHSRAIIIAKAHLYGITKGRSSMSNLLSTQEREEYIIHRSVAGLGYTTLIIGYMLTILISSQMTLLSFSLFTAFHLGYCFLLWWIRNARSWRFALVIVLLICLTEIVGLLPLLGLAWDWLLFPVTLSVLFSLASWRVALGSGVLLYILMTLNLLAIDNWNTSTAYPTLLELLSAFVFVTVFSLVMRLQQGQKDRAERLLRQLEESSGELARAHKQLQEYADEVEELAIVRERTRVAREIHDTLGHYLSILSIQLETISRLHERDHARTAVEIAEARRVATQSMQEVRNAVAALRPASIAMLSLPQALTQLAREFERSARGIQVTLDLEAQFPVLTTDIHVAFYRAAQEALTNVRKHAQASKVLIRLRYEEGVVELLVRDNGNISTHAKAQSGSGFGLIGLRERIELLNGQIVHGPSEQGGYRVTVRVPVPATAQMPAPGDQVSTERIEI